MWDDEFERASQYRDCLTGVIAILLIAGGLVVVLVATLIR